MALARRVLTLVIAAAVALAPLGAANAATRMHDAVPAAAQASEQHQHGTATEMAQAQACASAHSHMKCCPGDEHGKSDCSQACLQKCFGPLAVMPAGGNAPLVAARQFVFAATAPPTDWSSAPQPPPPRI